MENEDNFLNCDICDLAFTSVETFEQHIHGRKHQRKLEKEKKKGSHKKDSEKNVEDQSSSDTDDDQKKYDEEYLCRICSKKFSGVIPFSQHSKSTPHTKQVRRQRLVLKLAGAEEHEELGLDKSSPIYLLVQKPFASCKQCSKQFNCPESYQQHMISKAHKRRLIETQIIEYIKNNGKLDSEFFKSNIKEEVSNPDEQAGNTVVAKSYESKLIDRLEIKLAACNLENYAETQEDSEKLILSCEECDKTFSSYTPFVQHIISPAHEKKLKQIQIIKQIQENVSDQKKSRFQEQQDGEIIVIDDILVCEMCSVSFSGPESALAHQKSKKHKKKLNMVQYIKTRKTLGNSKKLEESASQVKEYQKKKY